MPQNTVMQGVKYDELTACAQCDWLHTRTDLPAGHQAHCQRCDAPLGKAAPASFDLTLALVLSGLVMLVIAHLNPVFGIDMQGHVQSSSLWEAAITLYHEDAWLLSFLVLMTTLVFPAAELLAMGYVLLALREGHKPAGFAQVLRVMNLVRPWVMVEVFMLGVLIALVKLAGLAEILPGVGLGAFAAVMLLLACVTASLDHHNLWQAVDAIQPSEM
jgi:paraquat-inducible protein A